MKFRVLLIFVLLISIFMILGCSNAETLDHEQNQELKLQINKLEEKLSTLKTTIEELNDKNSRMETEFVEMVKENSELIKKFNELKLHIRDTVE